MANTVLQNELKVRKLTRSQLGIERKKQLQEMQQWLFQQEKNWNWMITRSKIRRLANYVFEVAWNAELQRVSKLQKTKPHEALLE
jgi:hypothetical protein